jgi:hypothetical protein
MRNLLTLIASLGLVACVGGIDQPAGGGGDPADDPSTDGTGGGTTNPQAAAEAKQLYTDTVAPIVLAKCVSCHESGSPSGNLTGFVDRDNTKAYATAVGYQAVVGDYTPAGAPILTKITAGNHNGQTYSTDDQAKITAWLNKELEARSTTGGGTTPPPTGGETPAAASLRLVAEWSGCMTQANFEAADMRAWGNVNAGGGGACKTCHVLGEYGMVASDVTANYFDLITTNKYYMLQYFAVDLSGGVAAAKIIINDRSFKGVGLRLTPHEAHPNFNPTQNNGYAALQKFYQSTLAAKTAGTCGPSKLIN